MAKTNFERSILNKILVIASLVCAILLVATPVVFFTKDTLASAKPIWGWEFLPFISKHIVKDYSYYSVTLYFNWVLFIMILSFIAIAAVLFFIAVRKRAFYIVAAVAFVALAILSFTAAAHGFWVSQAMSTAGNTWIKDNLALGVGPWITGFASSFAVIASIYEFKAVKLR